MDELIFLGCGAAPGVPTITGEWGRCNPQNSKNKRSRAGIYLQIKSKKILIDTSADLRMQLLENNINNVNAVFYTHIHADHIMGIDDLRAFTYNSKEVLNIYSTEENISELRQRFSYIFTDMEKKQITRTPQLQPNIIKRNQPFHEGDIEVMPLRFSGHPVETTGYVFNRGRVVIIPDYKEIPDSTLEYLCNIDVDVLIMPLTAIDSSIYHAGIDTNHYYIDKISPHKVYWTHMGPQCDYDEVLRLCRENEMPAYDNLKIEL